MRNFKRNEFIDNIEQDVILGLFNSWNRFKKDWECDISLSDYMTALKLGLEHPELTKILRDDNVAWWSQGNESDN